MTAIDVPLTTSRGSLDRRTARSPTSASARCARRTAVSTSPSARRGPPHHRQPRRRHVPRLLISPKATALAAPSRSRPATHPAEPCRRPLRPDRLGRGVHARGRRAARGARAPRQRRRGHVPGQPRRALLGGDRRGVLLRKVLRIAQQLLGHLDRPAAPAPHVARDVRPLRAVPDPRHRPHRPHARLRRQPRRLQRLDHDGARGRHRLRPSAERGGTVVVVDPPAHRDRQARLRARRGQRPAAIPSCCSGCCTSSSPRTWPTSARSPRCDGPRRAARAWPRSGRRSAPPRTPVSTPRRSRASPASSPPPPARSPTDGSASASRRPARSPTG